MSIKDVIQEIKPLSQPVMEVAGRRWDSIAKPLKSLGKLERMIIQIAGITGSASVDIRKKALVVMCADNGVVAEGITQTGSEVTAIVAENFTKQKASVSIMCELAGTDIFTVDIGILTDIADSSDKLLPDRVYKCKQSYGTKNFAVEPAMTRAQAEKAILTGIETVRELKQQGYGLIATGEMGIGNTTTSSAVSAVLLDVEAAKVTGRGAGLSDEGVKRKIRVIEAAIVKHQPDRNDPVDVLAKVGGYDLAGLVGVFLGGARYQVPIVIDGFISETAALAARMICPEAGGYALASHVSKEPAGGMILEKLEKEPLLYAEMCLGEGTGAVAVLPVLDMAAAVYEKMSTFYQIDIEEYKPL